MIGIRPPLNAAEGAERVESRPHSSRSTTEVGMAWPHEIPRLRPDSAKARAERIHVRPEVAAGSREARSWPGASAWSADPQRIVAEGVREARVPPGGPQRIACRVAQRIAVGVSELSWYLALGLARACRPPFALCQPDATCW